MIVSRVSHRVARRMRGLRHARAAVENSLQRSSSLIRPEFLSNQTGPALSCTAVGYWPVVCPKGVDPANAINQNKVKSAKDYFLRFLSPKRTSS
jgi:succinate dehydrogenase/fumarate reductase-like Fe-S protein